MSRPLKKTIKNTGIIKVNKKVRTFTDKSDPILLKNFSLPLLQTHFVAIIQDYSFLTQT